MKRKLARKWQFPLMAATGVAPVPLLLGANAVPEHPLCGLAFAALYAVLAIALLLVPGRRRIVAGVAGALLLAASGAAMAVRLAAPLMLPACAAYVVLLILSLPMGGLSDQMELHPAWGAVGLGLHVLAQLLQLVDANSGDMIYPPVSPALKICFVCFALLALFAMNRNSLVDAAAKGNPAPASMRRKNRLLAFGLLAVALLIACLPAVIRAVQRLWELLLLGIGYLLMLLSKLLPQQGGGGGGGGAPDMSMLGLEQQDPSLFARIMEKIAMAGALVVAAVALFFLLRKLWRVLRVLLSALLKRLSEFAAAASEDYEDEISDTREDGESGWRLFRPRRRRDPLKGVDEAKLSPRERIRFHYLKLLYRHERWEPSRTARENLPMDAAQLYERARYSDHEVSGGDADSFAERVRRL